MANSEQSKWRDFLKPLVTAAAVALTAMAAYYQHDANSVTDSRVTALEVELREVKKQSEKLGDNVSVQLGSLRDVVSGMRSDISFIRGKMEASERR